MFSNSQVLKKHRKPKLLSVSSPTALSQESKICLMTVTVPSDPGTTLEPSLSYTGGNRTPKTT